jgi:hypothetical protein
MREALELLAKAARAYMDACNDDGVDAVLAADADLQAALTAADAALAATPGQSHSDRLEIAAREACDLLAERTFGNPARSAGHNARVCLESALNTATPARAVAP